MITANIIRKKTAEPAFYYGQNLTPGAIPNNTGGNLTRTITMPAGTGSAIEVLLSMTVPFRLNEHICTLTDPNANVTTLFSNEGGTGQALDIGTVIKFSAIGISGISNLPHIWILNPEEFETSKINSGTVAKAFTGLPLAAIAGNWILTMTDNVTSPFSGTLNWWSLKIYP